MKCFFKNLNNFLNNECKRKKTSLLSIIQKIPERHIKVDYNSAPVLRCSLKNTKEFINDLAISYWHTKNLQNPQN